MYLSKNDNNRNNVIKYISILLLILFHAFFIDIKSGVPLFIIFFFVPLISLAFVSAGTKKIKFSIRTDKRLYSKGEKISVEIMILSGSIIPLPFIHAHLTCSDKISGGSNFIFSLTKGKKCAIALEYSAECFGPAEISVGELRVYDCFGLFFYKYILPGKNYTINIIPNIPHIPDNNMLNESMNVTQNDSEDEVETDLFSFNKLPGYEHRKYIPGDPIKLINWKLSCKHDNYFVRNMESLASSKQMIVLDTLSSGDYTVDERTVEAVLAMVYAMLKRGISCNVVFFMDDTWRQIDISTETDLSKFAEILANFTFFNDIVNDNAYSLTDNINKTGINSCLLFTSRFNTRVSDIAEQIQSGGCFVYIASPVADILYKQNVWLISPEYSFNRAIT